ncbi:hypothetical protein TPY_2478 [Sulfobacillus acidophilus TPY]|uniref:MaoC domain protein dehydratase n=1 Tax=Sulfobacillus acidophilus (strain ATCC 700253 / DSM 10332 / NAL) TaxID=679936 RepID=G8TSI5_SULAD|nr:hypothetical protein TPY_2478 [Sulfobacillus acidophilus TPY]AEW06677.1 MaoC domain protein dehydratase [Sulfobacillus acidophilus DSM 10332]
MAVADEEWGPWTIQFTREQLVRYAGASGDYNPIHYDDQFARQMGLPGVIVHGMLQMGRVVSPLRSMVPPDARLVRYQVRFRGMVVPGESLTLTGRVKSQTAHELTVQIRLTKADGHLALTGEMVWQTP